MSASNPMLNDEQGAFERAPELATRVAQPGAVTQLQAEAERLLG